MKFIVDAQNWDKILEMLKSYNLIEMNNASIIGY